MGGPLTNHSLRKTLVKKVKSSNQAEHAIKSAKHVTQARAHWQTTKKVAKVSIDRCYPSSALPSDNRLRISLQLVLVSAFRLVLALRSHSHALAAYRKEKLNNVCVQDLTARSFTLPDETMCLITLTTTD